jgi:hypothetical protein
MGWNAQINDANLTLKCDANGAAASLAFLSLSLTIAFANRLNSNIRNTGSPPSAYDTDAQIQGWMKKRLPRGWAERHVLWGSHNWSSVHLCNRLHLVIVICQFLSIVTLIKTE